MDTEQARTFLAVIAAGNFNAAGALLHITQSTVSARIRSLEERLGCRLFTRNKAGAVLTAQGRQFQKHAATLVRTAELARQEVGIPRGFRASFNVAGRLGLWERLLQSWLPRMRHCMPDVSIRAEMGLDEEIMQSLVEGRCDLGLVYTPQSRPGLTVEALFDERLFLVSSDPAGAPLLGADYVYVDWGPEFHAKHGAGFPEFAGPALAVNLGWLAMRHIMLYGGSAYLPQRLVADLLQQQTLYRVAGAPEFPVTAYAVYSAQTDTDIRQVALRELRLLTCGNSAQTPGSNE